MLSEREPSNGWPDTDAERAQRVAFEAWAKNRWGACAYLHTGPTSGEWDAWKAASAPAPAKSLTDAQLDALDTFALATMAPRGRESVRQYARAVLAAAASAQ